MKFGFVLALSLGLWACEKSSYKTPVEALKPLCGTTDANFFPADAIIIKVLDAAGAELVGDALVHLQARVIYQTETGDSSRPLPLSPKACLALPRSEQGRLGVEVKIPGLAPTDELSLRKVQTEEEWSQAIATGHGAYVSLRLQKPLLLPFQLNCPSQGLHTSGSLNRLFESLNPPIPAHVKLGFEIASAADIRPRVAKKPASADDLAGLVNKRFDIASLGSGAYIFRLSAEDEGGRKVLFTSTSEEGESLAMPSLQCPIHLQTDRPRQPVPLAWKAAALSVKPGQLVEFDRDPDVDLLLCLKPGTAAQPAECAADDFVLHNEFVPRTPGFQWLCAKARDKASNESTNWCQELRVDGNAPELTVQWDLPELNQYAAVWRKTLGRFAATVGGFKDNVSTASELQGRLQCRVDWISPLGAVRPSEQVICRSGLCAGQNLSTFRDCDSKLEFEVNEDRLTVAHQHLSLVVKVEDAAGNATEARQQFLIGDTFTPFLSGEIIRQIMPDPRVPDKTWMATDAGVFAVTPSGVVVYNSSSGLPSSTVRALLPANDERGGIWAATFKGVAYFDGERWTTATDFPASFAYSLALDKDGQLLVGASDLLARRSKTGAWEILGDFTAEEATVYALEVDAKGIIWAGTNHGLYSYDGRQWQHFDAASQALPNDQIWDLMLDQQGTLWIATDSGLAHRRDEGFLRMESSRSALPSQAIYRLFEDKQGRLLVGTEGGFGRWDGHTWEIMDQRGVGLPNNNVWAFYEDPRQRLWVGTEGGGARFGGNDFVVFNRSNSGLPGDPVHALIEDAAGRLWVGTDTALGRIDADHWTNFREKSGGLPAGYMRSFALDQQQRLWVASDFGRIAYFDGKRWVMERDETGAATNNTVYNILSTADGRMMSGGNAGYTEFDGKAWTPFTADWVSSGEGEPAEGGSILFDLLQTRSGEILAATDNNAVVRWEGSRWLPLPGTAAMHSRYRTSWVVALVEDAKGTLWAGTDKGLAERVGSSWIMRNRDERDPLYVRALLAARDGSIWIGTKANGLVRYKEKQWTVFQKYSHALPSDSILSLTEDGLGRIWVGTKSGLARWEPEEP